MDNKINPNYNINSIKKNRPTFGLSPSKVKIPKKVDEFLNMKPKLATHDGDTFVKKETTAAKPRWGNLCVTEPQWGKLCTDEPQYKTNPVINFIEKSIEKMTKP